jgi:hypothetical protein
MLHEYALDPNVISTWQSFRYFIENFGVSQGRMLSKYPKKWKKMVYEACSGCPDGTERKRIEEKLMEIDDKLIRCPYPFDTSLPWLTNAEASRGAFRAIISMINPNNHDNVLIADEIQGSEPLWKVPREKPVPRSAQAMADCAERLLWYAKEILFVDPHFDPAKSRYRNTLKAFIEKISDPAKIRRIEYHLSKRYASDYFRDELVKRVPCILKEGITITFIRWEEADHGESIHPRYILTDFGGMRFEHGLDEEPGGPTVDVGLLDADLYKTRWNDYQKETKSFVYVDEFAITGIR